MLPAFILCSLRIPLVFPQPPSSYIDTSSRCVFSLAITITDGLLIHSFLVFVISHTCLTSLAWQSGYWPRIPALPNSEPHPQLCTQTAGCPITVAFWWRPMLLQLLTGTSTSLANVYSVTRIRNGKHHMPSWHEMSLHMCHFLPCSCCFQHLLTLAHIFPS